MNTAKNDPASTDDVEFLHKVAEYRDSVGLDSNEAALEEVMDHSCRLNAAKTDALP